MLPASCLVLLFNSARCRQGCNRMLLFVVVVCRNLCMCFFLAFLFSGGFEL